eukprot:1149303-Pelagomonas_calceolata.AAC.2
MTKSLPKGKRCPLMCNAHQFHVLNNFLLKNCLRKEKRRLRQPKAACSKERCPKQLSLTCNLQTGVDEMREAYRRRLETMMRDLTDLSRAVAIMQVGHGALNDGHRWPSFRLGRKFGAFLEIGSKEGQIGSQGAQKSLL